MKRLLLIALFFIPNLSLKANQDVLKLPLITLDNYSEKCKPSFKQAYLKNLYKSLPKKQSTKGIDAKKEFYKIADIWDYNAAIWDRKSNLSKEYSKRCVVYCTYMNKIKPTNEGYIHAGNYGPTDAAFCRDRWVKKINKKGDRLEFVWGSTNRIKGLDGLPQTISDKNKKYKTSLVNCSTWESWNKFEKIWEPISKGNIIDYGAEKFCKKSFFGLGPF